MIILVSSKVSHSTIHASLGKPEYSYFFLMRDFLPALERIGQVVQVASVDEIQALHTRYAANGQAVVFLSVSPPHQTPLGLPCPTVTLFAWEFDSLPNTAWEANPQNDWRYVFARSHGAICTSQETAQLVCAAAGPDFPVIALPAPIWDRYAALGAEKGWACTLTARDFPFAGTVIDSPTLGLSADGLVQKPPASGDALPPTPPAPRISLRRAMQLSRGLLGGWWRDVRPQRYKDRAREAADLEAARPKPVAVSGVVYSTVLNPADGRKNWVDLITAFCWAFKDTEDATLIVKMTHHDLEYYRIVLLTLLSRLAPFRCRVLVLHGFLEDEQYQALIQASSYYVNASTGEGLCLPLMEFLSGGKPVIAPAHSAMADYLNEQLAFLLHTSLEPACWPHDPTGMLHTHRHRLNWQSLMEAFRHSYAVARDNPQRYQQMSSQAYVQMRDFASTEQVGKPLEAFLQQVLQQASRNHIEMAP